MLIAGEWLRWDDGILRPIIEAKVLGAQGKLHNGNFLVDIGADRTVLSASLLQALGPTILEPAEETEVEGVGGKSSIVSFHTIIQFTRLDGGACRVHGQLAAFTDPRATDFNILGRDVLNIFDVIISRRRNEVLLLAESHRHQIVED